MDIMFFQLILKVSQQLCYNRLLLHALDKKENEKTRSEARQKQTKQDKVSDLKFITTYNPALPNFHNIIQNNLSILHTDENMKKIFPSN